MYVHRVVIRKLFNFAAKVPSQSCLCVLKVLISLHAIFFIFIIIILVKFYSYSSSFLGLSKYSAYHFCSKIFIQWINITVQSVF